MAEAKPSHSGGRRQPAGAEVAPSPTPGSGTSGDDGASEAAQRTAMREHVSRIAQEAALEAPAHRIAADRDRWTSTAISCLSAAAAAAAGFSGLGTVIPKAGVSALALGSALLTAVVAILVKNSRAADHSTACQGFDVLQHDAQDFCSVTVVVEKIDQVQKAYDGLISKRDQILKTAPPVTDRSKKKADSMLTSRPSMEISEHVRNQFLNSGEGSRLRFGSTSARSPRQAPPPADPHR